MDRKTERVRRYRKAFPDDNRTDDEIISGLDAIKKRKEKLDAAIAEKVEAPDL
jgi:hypothetical protein